MKLKLNDTIKVISGDDKGRTGKISKILPTSQKVLIDGVNTYKKHLKPQEGREGGVVTLSRSIHISKVQLVCPHCGQNTKIKLEGKGKDKLRICKKCQKPITSELKNKKNK